MRVKLTRRLALLFVSTVLSAWAVSCAEDAGVDTGYTPIDGGEEAAGGAAGAGGASGTGGGGGWPTSGLGSPCKLDADCTSKQCTDIGQSKPNKVCTESCKAGKPCANGGYCAWQPEKGYVCVPDTGSQCSQCAASADCKNVGDECVTSPLFDRFCGRDCSFDGICPSGFSCVSPSAYGPGGTPDGGAPDGGAPEGGVGEAGAQPDPHRVCVPDSGDSCPCSDKYAGQTRTCFQASGAFTCEGKETCNGSTGAWEGCSASSPKAETCDGADNDCDGVKDNGTDDALCAGEGPKPAHSSWVCDKSAGQCSVGTCDVGWARYPTNLPPSAGCACQVEPADQSPASNDTCASATPSGTVSDANTNALTLTGRLSSDTDEDWYRFETVDADNGAQNDYHIRIRFTAPAPSNDEFVFDVIRGSTCASTDAKHSELTEYDWCVDGAGTDSGGAAIGEGSCGPSTSRHCGPHDQSYLVRVHRKAGAVGSCSSYTLTVTAKGGDACDFSQATGTCDAQVNQQ